MDSDRWQFSRDMNRDGVFTISDIWLWFQWIFFLPGDALLAATMSNQWLATFLEITPLNYGGWLSGIVSAIAWVILLGIAWLLFRD